MYRSPEKVSNVTDALGRSGHWRDEAACRDASDPDIFFTEGYSDDKDSIGSSLTTEAFLLCATCPVRRECATEALTPFQHHVRPDESPVQVRVRGIWAGTTFKERMAVRSLPVPEAVERLEAGLPERVRVRAEAFEKRHPPGHHRQCLNGRCAPARVLLDAMRERITAPSLGGSPCSHSVST